MNRDLDLAGFELHPQRGSVLGEVHARPFTRLTAPLTVLRFAFLNQGEVAAADRQKFVAFCTSHGQAPMKSCSDFRQRSGDKQGPYQSHFRAVLHNQTGRRRNRTWPVDQLRDRAGAWLASFTQPTSRTAVPRSPSCCRRSKA
jgi:hypothetical protein